MEKRNLRRSVMTSTTTVKLGKLIHIGRIIASDGRARYVFLRKQLPEGFLWYECITPTTEVETSVVGPTIEEAIRLGIRQWSKQAYRNVMCGIRYMLPERDEHGSNALFWQMAASQNTMNGVYYDDELGNNCTVQNASIEAFNLWQRLKKEDRL